MKAECDYRLGIYEKAQMCIRDRVRIVHICSDFFNAHIQPFYFFRQREEKYQKYL